jgi:hypothetical protein
MVKDAKMHIANKNRVYSSFMSGILAEKVIRNVREHFHDNSICVLFLHLGIDGSPITSEKELTPVTMRILNYARHVRNKSMRLVGYMESVAFSTKESSNTSEAREIKRFALVSQFLHLLDGISQLQACGPFLLQNLNVYPVLALLSLDNKEKVCLLNMGGGYQHCTSCFAKGPFEKYVGDSDRTLWITQKIVSWSRHKLSDKCSIGQNIALFQASGQHTEGEFEIHPSDSKLDFGHEGGINAIAPPDVLHGYELGVEKWVFQYFVLKLGNGQFTDKEIRSAMDIGSGATIHEARRKIRVNGTIGSFSNVIASFDASGRYIFSGGKTAERYTEDLHKVLLGLLLIRKEITVKNEKIRKFLISIADSFVLDILFILLGYCSLKRREHTAKTLKDLDSILENVFYIDLKYRRSKNSKAANPVKAHNLVHICDFIKLYGSSLEFDTQETEHDHIYTVKRIKNCTERGNNVAESALFRRIEVDTARNVLEFCQRSGAFPYFVSKKETATKFGRKPLINTQDAMIKLLQEKKMKAVKLDDFNESTDYEMEEANSRFECTVRVPYKYSDCEDVCFQSYTTSKTKRINDCLYRTMHNKLYLVLFYKICEFELREEVWIDACCIPLENVDLTLEEKEALVKRYIFHGSLSKTEISAQAIPLFALKPVESFEYKPNLFIAYPKSGALFLDETYLL